MFGEHMCVQVQNWVDLTFCAVSCILQRWRLIDCGFCLLHVFEGTKFQICSWLTGVGRDKEVGGTLFLSLLQVSLDFTWISRFAVLYHRNTHVFWSGPAHGTSLAKAHAHAGKAKERPRGAPDQLHFNASEQLNICKGVLCHITQRSLPLPLLSGLT